MLTPAHKTGETPVKLFHETARGRIFIGDSLGMFREEIEPGSVDRPFRNWRQHSVQGAW
jgi:hypothetical protein